MMMGTVKCLDSKSGILCKAHSILCNLNCLFETKLY